MEGVLEINSGTVLLEFVEVGTSAKIVYSTIVTGVWVVL